MSFLKAYEDKAKGEYKNLRTISSSEEGEPTWDIVRNRELKKIWKEFEESKPDLWNSDDLPTKEHLQLILWAYSPEASKIKKHVSSYEEKLSGLKISNEKESLGEKSTKKTNEDEGKSKRKSHKRKSESSNSSSSSGSNDETPKKKNKAE